MGKRADVGFRGVWAACLCAASAVLAACAGVTHRPVPPGAEASVDGIRYYQTSLYLLVYADGKGGLKHKIMELPDSTKMMVAEPYSTLSSLEMELNFTNGGLTSAKDTPDSAKVPEAVVAALGTFLPALAAGGFVGLTEGRGPDLVLTKEHVVPAPRLYKIVVQGGKVCFLGDPSEVPVHVTLGPKPPEPPPVPKEEKKKEPETPPANPAPGTTPPKPGK